MVHSGTIGQGERGSSGGRGSGLLPSSGGGDLGSAGEEGSNSSVDPSNWTLERFLRRRLVLRKRYEESKVRVEYLNSIGCFGWGPGITE